MAQNRDRTSAIIRVGVVQVPYDAKAWRRADLDEGVQQVESKPGIFVLRLQRVVRGVQRRYCRGCSWPDLTKGRYGTLHLINILMIDQLGKRGNSILGRGPKAGKNSRCPATSNLVIALKTLDQGRQSRGTNRDQCPDAW